MVDFVAVAGSEPRLGVAPLILSLRVREGAVFEGDVNVIEGIREQCPRTVIAGMEGVEVMLVSRRAAGSATTGGF